MTDLAQHRRSVLRPHRHGPRPGRAHRRRGARTAWTTASCSSNTASRKALALRRRAHQERRRSTRRQGFGLRAVAGEATGYAHASELSEEAIKRAGDTVRAVASGHRRRHGRAAARHQPRALYRRSIRWHAVDFAAKTKLLAEIDAYARAKDPRVRQVSASICGRLAGGADHPRRRQPRRRYPPAGAAQRQRSWSARATAWRPARYGAGGRVDYERYLDPAQLAGARSTRRCARRWSISARCRRRPAR